MTLTRKLFIGFLSVLTLTMTPMLSSKASAAYNLSPVCNTSSSWKLAKSVSTNIGLLRVYKNGTSICGVHYNTTGKRLYVGASISIAGREVARDFGHFLYYAGPVRTSLPVGKCAVVTGYQVLTFKPDGTPGTGWGVDTTVCQ